MNTNYEQNLNKNKKQFLACIDGIPLERLESMMTEFLDVLEFHKVNVLIRRKKDKALSEMFYKDFGVSYREAKERYLDGNLTKEKTNLFYDLLSQYDNNLKNRMDAIKTFADAMKEYAYFKNGCEYTSTDSEFHPENLLGVIHNGLVLENLIKELKV